MSVRLCPQSDPKNPFHKRLEAEVTEFLTANDYIVESNTYHDARLEACPKRQAFIRRAVVMRNPNILVVRTRSDRIAAHKTKDHSFCLEFKTISGKHDNLTIEALPLAMHRDAGRLGERCLYVFRDERPGKMIDGCFWAHLPIPCESLWIPPQHKGSKLERYLALAFTGLEIVNHPVGGSGDPFIRIPRSELRPPFVFPDWRAACLSTSIPELEGTDEPQTRATNGPYPAKAATEVPRDLF